jgi:hypothetical protein
MLTGRFRVSGWFFSRVWENPSVSDAFPFFYQARACYFFFRVKVVGIFTGCGDGRTGSSSLGWPYPSGLDVSSNVPP